MIETEPQQVQLYVSFLHGLSVPKELPPHPIHILRTQGDICSFAFGLQTKVGMLCRASETHSLDMALISTQSTEPLTGIQRDTHSALPETETTESKPS